MVYPYSGILLRNKKKQIIDAGGNMDESQKYCAEQKEQVEKCILFMIQYIYDILEQAKLIPTVTVISGYPEVVWVWDLLAWCLVLLEAHQVLVCLFSDGSI